MNTNLEQMCDRCPAARRMGNRMLVEHRLVFRGVADIEPCKNSYVWGVLWDITKCCEDELDQLEGYPHVYSKKTVPVTNYNMPPLEAMVYHMPDAYTYAAPSTFYLNMLLIGYKQNGLSTDQIVNAMGYDR